MARLPATLDEALDNLAADEILTAALGPTLLEGYLAIRRSEAAAYRGMEEEAEYASHFARY
jgi:glutamine synthetase